MAITPSCLDYQCGFVLMNLFFQVAPASAVLGRAHVLHVCLPHARGGYREAGGVHTDQHRQGHSLATLRTTVK